MVSHHADGGEAAFKRKFTSPFGRGDHRQKIGAVLALIKVIRMPNNGFKTHLSRINPFRDFNTISDGSCLFGQQLHLSIQLTQLHIRLLAHGCYGPTRNLAFVFGANDGATRRVGISQQAW